MFYVYVLESCCDGSCYTGYTDDLRRRLSEHNGKKSKHTKAKTPFDLIYCEAYKKKCYSERGFPQIRLGKGLCEENA